MKLRLILFLFVLLPYVYDAVTLFITDEQRTKPLPEEVKDVYTEERWNSFVAYKKDMRLPYLLEKGWALLLDAVVLFTPLYALFERFANGNVYLLVLITVLVLSLIPLIADLPLAWYRTFVVRSRYGLNHQTPKDFWKDQITGLLFGIVLTFAAYSLLAWILTHVSEWTNGFSVSVGHAFLLMAGIALLIVIFVVIAMFLSWGLMRIQYHFTPLEEGELKEKILQLIKGSRKKVRSIEVYDESRKSTSKNAFVLKLPFIRTIGIADNFLAENAEDELLAVLSHEAGHLKHTIDIYNVISWLIPACAFLICVALIVNGNRVMELEKRLEESFGLSMMNPVLSFAAVSWLTSPLLFLVSAYGKYRSRREEYEADRNAVKEGYGEALIRTFKTLSSDELVDVNPAPLIEALEFDHPGMTNRIRAIRKAEDLRIKKEAA